MIDHNYQGTPGDDTSVFGNSENPGPTIRYVKLGGGAHLQRMKISLVLRILPLE